MLRTKRPLTLFISSDSSLVRETEERWVDPTMHALSATITYLCLTYGCRQEAFLIRISPSKACVSQRPSQCRASLSPVHFDSPSPNHTVPPFNHHDITQGIASTNKARLKGGERSWYRLLLHRPETLLRWNRVLIVFVKGS